MKKTNLSPAENGKSPQRRFERFVSALLRVPKKEVDEKEALHAKKRMDKRQKDDSSFSE